MSDIIAEYEPAQQGKEYYIVEVYYPRTNDTDSFWSVVPFSATFIKQDAKNQAQEAAMQQHITSRVVRIYPSD